MNIGLKNKDKNMKISIEITGRKAIVESGNYREEMKLTWLLKQFKLNDLYHYLIDKNTSL